MGAAASARRKGNFSESVQVPQQNVPEKSIEQTLEKYPYGRLNVYYASQLGTSEGFARILVKEGTAAGLDVQKMNLESFDKSELEKCRVAVFLMANTGEGEPPDNGKKFFSWLTTQAAPGSLSGVPVNFTVFGLGNSTYENFNNVGRKTNAKLEAIGCKRVFEYGEGDDSKDLDADFKAWRNRMWPVIKLQCSAEGAAAVAAAGVEGSGDVLVSPRRAVPAEEVKVTLHFHLKEATSEVTVPTVDVSKVDSATRHFFTASRAKVLVNRELRNDSSSVTNGTGSGSTRHIEIDITGTGIKYLPADNLSILPENDPEVVKSVANKLGYSLDKTYYVEPIGESKCSLPFPCTLRDALTRYFDLQGRARSGTLVDLLPYVTDGKQKEWLRRVAEDRDEYKKIIVDEYRTIADLLVNELSSCQIPLEDFLHVLPFLQPRQYTISSSSSKYPDTIHLTAAITMKSSSSGTMKKFKGLCSRYLETLEPGVSTCQVFVTSSTFRLPKELSTPIIMFGPGTGVAPMRALLQEREYQGGHQAKQDCDCAPFGNNTLYFGCKNRGVDYIYREELEELVKQEVLTRLHLAFSRDQKEKVYVQTALKQPENAAKFIDELNSGAYIYVCGNTGMGRDVNNAIISIIMQANKLDVEEATEVVQKLREKGRYVQEVWSDA